MLYRLLAVPANQLGRPGQFIGGYVLPAIIGTAVALFSVVSWRVQQIYGCALEMAHLRAAGDLATMGDSIAAYATPRRHRVRRHRRLHGVRRPGKYC